MKAITTKEIGSTIAEALALKKKNILYVLANNNAYVKNLAWGV